MLMRSLSAKPAGSQIQEREDWDGLTLSWSPAPGGSRPYGGIAFMLFWLGGWAFGWVLAARALLLGEFDPFLAAWLGAWTLGGAWATWFLWNMMRPGRPESVTLGQHEPRHDPGLALITSLSYQQPVQAGKLRPEWNIFDRPPPPVTLLKPDIKAFVLDRVGERQRLFFDHGAVRIEIGAALSEPEREWLWGLLEDWRRS